MKAGLLLTDISSKDIYGVDGGLNDWKTSFLKKYYGDDFQAPENHDVVLTRDEAILINVL